MFNHCVKTWNPTHLIAFIVQYNKCKCFSAYHHSIIWVPRVNPPLTSHHYTLQHNWAGIKFMPPPIFVTSGTFTCLKVSIIRIAVILGVDQLIDQLCRYTHGLIYNVLIHHAPIYIAPKYESYNQILCIDYNTWSNIPLQGMVHRSIISPNEIILSTVKLICLV